MRTTVRDYAIVASSSPHLLKSDQETIGIVRNHGYALLNVHEYNGIRLVYLRNPWGRTEWKGKWSPKSDAWTKELKAAFKFDYQPGAFWISVEDFVKYFDAMTICYFRENWEYSSVPC